MEPLRPVLLALLGDRKCGAALLPKAQEHKGQRSSLGSMEGRADIKVRKVCGSQELTQNLLWDVLPGFKVIMNSG